MTEMEIFSGQEIGWGAENARTMLLSGEFKQTPILAAPCLPADGNPAEMNFLSYI